ncbi:MAG: hypothetical protein Q4E35_02970 [Eubacteriales bacterium]|nr:hypothetical protein [Eubacteriales bacterium]
MKKALILVVMLSLMLCLCTCGKPPEPPRPDYIKMMIDAAYSGDRDLGGRIEALMSRSQENDSAVDFNELCTLSRFMRDAYGDMRYTDKLRLYAGAVVLNRMESTEYPDSMSEVISGMGYDTEEINSVQPRKTDIRLAMRLLRGEKVIDPSVVIISDTPPEEPYATFCDSLRGNVYFSRK